MENAAAYRVRTRIASITQLANRWLVVGMRAGRAPLVRSMAASANAFARSVVAA